MPFSVYRTVRRDPDWALGPTLYEETIEAPTAGAAIAQSRNVDPDMAALGTNAVDLTSVGDCRTI